MVTIMPRAGVLDPQGEAIARALAGLGFSGVRGVRQGKVIEIDLEEGGQDAVRAMCEALLVNAVIEDYRIDLA